jgi:hypothetical protein
MVNISWRFHGAKWVEPAFNLMVFHFITAAGLLIQGAHTPGVSIQYERSSTRHTQTYIRHSTRNRSSRTLHPNRPSLPLSLQHATGRLCIDQVFCFTVCSRLVVSRCAVISSVFSSIGPALPLPRPLVKLIKDLLRYPIQ